VRRWFHSFVFVIISVGIATLMTFPLRQATVHNLGLFLIAAVMVSARYEGTAAGIASALLSTVVFDWFFDQGPYHLDFDLAALIRALAFCSFALLVGSLEKQRLRVLRSLQETNQSLQHALDEVKTLHGLLPICAYCKQVRADDGSWVRLEKYIREHTMLTSPTACAPTATKNTIRRSTKNTTQLRES
jgi:K+-sensing histidine kinase KdpD